MFFSDDDDSSQSTDEDVDLEEGEILDSDGAEEEKEKKDLTNSECFAFLIILKFLFKGRLEKLMTKKCRF